MSGRGKGSKKKTKFHSTLTPLPPHTHTLMLEYAIHVFILELFAYLCWSLAMGGREQRLDAGLDLRCRVRFKVYSCNSILD